MMTDYGDDSERSAQAAEYDEALVSSLDDGNPAFEIANPELARTLRLLNSVFHPPPDAERESPVELPPVPLPERIGRFQIQSLLGQGGMGTVYLAIDPKLGRLVAIKVPRTDLQATAQSHRRLNREARAAATLDHAGIVQVYEVGDASASGHTLYLVLAYCDGQDLGRWIAAQTAPTDARLAAKLIADVATAVQHGHQHNVLHRDLKPANILLFPLENDAAENELPWIPRVTDFGLSRSLDRQLRETGGSMLLGTPLYMSLEQAECRDDDVGVGADIFALGAILYHLLTGTPPFAAESYPAVLQRLRNERLQPISDLRSNVHVDLQTICHKCLQRDAVDRYQSAADVSADLNRFLIGQPITARPVGIVQRLRQRVEHPARLSEATAVIVSAAVTRIVFAVVGMALVLAMGEAAPTRTELIPFLCQLYLVTVPVDVAHIVMALRNRRGSLPFAIAQFAFVASLICGVGTFLVALDVAPAPLWYQRMPAARMTVFSLIGVTYVIQTLGWCFAAGRREKHGGTSFRTAFKYFITLGVTALATALLGAIW